MDGLSIITGISMLVFLLFYLAFNLSDKNKLLVISKLFLIFFGLFLLAYIPSTIITLDRDCSISDNGTYRCFYSNGTEVVNFGTPAIGSGFTTSYLYFLYVAVAAILIVGTIIGGKWFVDWYKGRKLI